MGRIFEEEQDQIYLIPNYFGTCVIYYLNEERLGQHKRSQNIGTEKTGSIAIECNKMSLLGPEQSL